MVEYKVDIWGKNFLSCQQEFRVGIRLVSLKQKTLTTNIHSQTSAETSRQQN